MEKRPRRRTAESQETFRRELVECAKALFYEKGVDAVSVRAVTEAFGMSPMSFYGYFASKQELIRFIWVDFFRELLERLIDAGDGHRSPLQVMEAHIRAYLGYWEAHPEHYRMVFNSEALASEAARDAFAGDPTYQRLIALTRERVLACSFGAPISERALRLTLDQIFVKAVGYLQVSLCVRRYELLDPEHLRRLVVRDIVATAARRSA